MFSSESYGFLPVGMIVFDPTNFAKNAGTMYNTYNTLVKAREEYKMLTRNHNLSLTNLEELSNIMQLIEDINTTVNKHYGKSPMSKFAGLDPNNPNYIETRNAILSMYYQQPQNPNYIQAEFQGALNQNQINSMMAQAKLQGLNYQELKDAIDESTYEQAVAKQRARDIGVYGKTIEGLGAKSELKTEQTTASEVNFQLQQNEQLIQLQNENLKYERMQKAEVDSEKAQESEAEQSDLERAINQGNSGLGRSKWGNY